MSVPDRTSILALGLALALAACGPSAPPGPSLLLVTIDTTRADRIGAYGHEAARTPTLDALARRGLLFERAYAPAPITLPSHASVLTGVYPTAHGVRNNTLYRVSDESLLLSEVLSERGWQTGAFVGSFVLAPRFGLDQGFDVYDAPTPQAPDPDYPGGLERRAGNVVDRALAWIDTLDGVQPFFAWVHFYDPHASYDPPEPFASELADAYDGEIAYADAQLGRLLAALGARGLSDDLAVVVTSDHGESLGEHGEPTHGLFVYEEAMRVPLVYVPPGGASTPSRIARPVSITDVAPTLLEAAGLPPGTLPDVHVPSLLATEPERALYLETLLPYHHHRWHPLQAVVWRDSKLIVAGRPELYDLAADPDEVEDLAALDTSRVAAMTRRLDQLLDQHRSLGWEQEQALSSDELGHLAALGYLGTDGGGDPFTDDLPDPRDRVGDLELKREAARLLQEGVTSMGPGGAGGLAAMGERREHGRTLLAQARDLFTQLLQAHPIDPQATAGLGAAEMALGHTAQAIAAFERHVDTVPLDARTRFQLGQCYLKAGRDDEAIAEVGRAISADPHLFGAYRWLASRHSTRDEHGLALFWLQELGRVANLSEPARAQLESDIARAQQSAARAGQRATPPPGFQAGR